MRRGVVSLPDGHLWDKPCTCTSVSGRMVVRREDGRGGLSFCVDCEVIEPSVNLPDDQTETMKGGCGHDMLMLVCKVITRIGGMAL